MGAFAFLYQHVPLRGNWRFVQTVPPFGKHGLFPVWLLNGLCWPPPLNRPLFRCPVVEKIGCKGRIIPPVVYTIIEIVFTQRLYALYLAVRPLFPDCLFIYPGYNAMNVNAPAALSPAHYRNRYHAGKGVLQAPYIVIQHPPRRFEILR